MNSLHTGWAEKSKPANFCNNFVYCQTIFIIFGTHTLEEMCNWGYIVSPPNMVCVTALPCKILTTTFFVLNFIYCCKKSSFYFDSKIIFFKQQKICTLAKIHVKKQHNKELWHITEMLSIVIKDLLLHKCPLLSRIA